MRDNRRKLLLPANMPAAAWEAARARPDVEGVAFEHDMPTAALHELLRDAHGIALGLTPFGEPELRAAPMLKAVARIGVGYDTVDVAALTRQGVPLLITGIANSISVAEQALFFLLALAKRGAALDAAVREGRWRAGMGEPPVDLYGKTVLLVGHGRIGSRMARRCLAMEMTVLVYDPYLPAAEIAAAGCEVVPELDAALPRADFVSIHCPKTPETVGLFDAARLARMKPGACLVNTARGGIVDETALYSALARGTLRGAGLDVFDREPPSPDNPLLTLPNVIVAPHMAGVTQEAFERMAAAAVRNLLDALEGRYEPAHVVNPEALGAPRQ